MGELLQQAGAGGAFLVVLGFVGIPLGLVALALSTVSRAFRPALVVAGLALGIGLMAITLSVSWRASDRSATLRAVAQASPADRATIMAGSIGAAESVTRLGALVGLPLMLLASGAFAAAFARTGGRS